MEQLNVVDGRIADYVGRLEVRLEDMDEKIRNLEGIVQRQERGLDAVIESHEHLRFSLNQYVSGIPIGHVRSRWSRNSHDGRSPSAEPENAEAIPVPGPRRGIQLGGHSGRAMQDRSRRRKDRSRRGVGDSPSSSSSKENISPPPSSSSSGLGAEIRGDVVATITNTRRSVSPDYEEVVRMSVGNPTATLVEIEEMLAHEEEMEAETNEQVLNVPLDVLVEIPAELLVPLPVPPFVVHDL